MSQYSYKISKFQNWRGAGDIYFAVELLIKTLMDIPIKPEAYYQEGFRLEVYSQNFSKALKMYEKAARLGHIEAQYCCGLMYLNGTGSSKSDFKKAFRFIQAAASQDNPKAQYLLAKMYYFGEGVERNKQLGDEWMEKFNFHDNKRKVLFLQPRNYPIESKVDSKELKVESRK